MAITVNEINNKIIADGDSVKIIAIAEQGPAGVSVGIDELTIDLNSENDAEIKGFESAADNTVIHKRSGLIAFVDQNEAKVYIDFTTGVGVSPQARRLWWNDSDQTLNLGISTDVTLQLGQEMHMRARNVGADVLVNGDIVYISGSTGSIPNVQKAIASNYSQSIEVIAMVTETSIAVNGFGIISTMGLVRGLNTSTLDEGGLVYLSAATAGKYTETKPAYPNNPVAAGYCIYKHNTNGIILFFPKFFSNKFGDITGGNYSGFNDSGRMVMVGDAKGWRDELNDISKVQNSGSGFSVNPIECCVDVIQAANLSDYLYQNIQLNHDRDLTANIFPHMHFWQTQNLLPNFLLDYRWQKKNGAKVTDWTRIPLNTLLETYTSGTLNQIATTESGIAVPVGTDISDIVQFRFYRDYGNASGLFAGITPHSGTMSLLSFDVHIKFDSLGSATQGTK